MLVCWALFHMICHHRPTETPFVVIYNVNLWFYALKTQLPTQRSWCLPTWQHGTQPSLVPWGQMWFWIQLKLKRDLSGCRLEQQAPTQVRARALLLATAHIWIIVPAAMCFCIQTTTSHVSYFTHTWSSIMSNMFIMSIRSIRRQFYLFPNDVQ